MIMLMWLREKHIFAKDFSKGNYVEDINIISLWSCLFYVYLLIFSYTCLVNMHTSMTDFIYFNFYILLWAHRKKGPKFFCQLMCKSGLILI